MQSFEPTCQIAPADLLKPALPRPVTHFRDWYVGCRVLSTVHGYGTVKAFPLTDFALASVWESQRVEWVDVDFDQVGRQQMPPNSRDLKLVSPKSPKPEKSR